MKKPQCLIGAAASSSGKTTLTLGLLRAFKNRGLSVQPFKCGPDYIDVQHHTRAAGKTGINLDAFMMSKSHIQDTYAQYSSTADAVLVEGVMGLFDGAVKSDGSSAEIAKLLNIPVILIIDARATAYSVAPLIYGFKHFDPELQIAGAIFNFVNTKTHYRFLKEACNDVNVEALGYVSHHPDLQIPSRHLGLILASEYKINDMIARHIEENIDLDRILEISSSAIETVLQKPCKQLKSLFNIAVAYDEAFNFTYYQNIKLLEQFGKLTHFSPLNDTQLPEADLIYLSGGYPELHLQKLSENQVMKNDLLSYCQKGGKVLAECGGMMYLGNSIIDKSGKSYPMTGFLDIQSSMENMRLHLGYRKIKFPSFEIRGHEFHYSTCQEMSAMNSPASAVNARGEAVTTRIYQKKNTLASYIHFYWGENSTFLEQFLGSFPP